MPVDLRMAPAAVTAWLTTALLAERAPSMALRAACVFAVLGCLAAFAAVVKRHREPMATLARVALVVLVLAGAAALNVGLRSSAIAQSPYRELAEKKVSATINATVVAEPALVDVHGRPTTIFELKLTSAEHSGQRITGSGTVTAFGDEDAAGLRAGQRVRMRARFAAPDSTAEVATISVVNIKRVRAGPWWWTGSSAVRDAIADAAASGPTVGARIVPALVDGDQSRVGDLMHEDFRRSGLLHVMVVSGAKLTIVLAFLLIVGQLCGIRKHGRWVLGAMAIVAFVLLARTEPSVLRAAAMGVVTLAAVGYGGRSGVRCLCWGLIALLLMDPWLGRSVGFTMSVCATAGIVLVAPPLARRMATWMPYWLAMIIAVPFAAQLACTPIIAAFSGEISLVAVLANVLAAPAVVPATVGGLGAGLIWLISPALAYPIAVVANVCATWVVTVARHASAMTGGVVEWTQPWWILVPACIAVIAAMWWCAGHASVLIGVSAACLLLMWKPPAPGWPPDDWLMVACDVGQGDATVLAAGDGSAIVVDAGPEPGPVDRCLKRLDIERVPVMIFTHDHADHTGGWQGVRRGRTVGHVLIGPSGSPLSGGRGDSQHGKDKHAGDHADIVSVAAGDTFHAGSLSGTVLWPPPDWTVGGDDGTSINNASVVVRIDAPEASVLLPGDIETEAQRQLESGQLESGHLVSGTELHSDVLKMPHHGSARQSRRFFEATSARLVTVSAGQDNDYGHPTREALELANESQMRIVRTDQHADIAVVADDGQLRVVTRR